LNKVHTIFSSNVTCSHHDYDIAKKFIISPTFGIEQQSHSLKSITEFDKLTVDGFVACLTSV